jgi:hypothetical protein
MAVNLNLLDPYLKDIFRWWKNHIDPGATVTSGDRTISRQRDLYQECLTGLRSGQVAFPGCSQHNARYATAYGASRGAMAMDLSLPGCQQRAFPRVAGCLLSSRDYAQLVMNRTWGVTTIPIGQQSLHVQMYHGADYRSWIEGHGINCGPPCVR